MNGILPLHLREISHFREGHIEPCDQTAMWT
jgi:hypothetical protein